MGGGSNLRKSLQVKAIRDEHPFLNLWDQAARDWAREQYESLEFQRVRDRFIAINKELLSLPRVGPERRALVEEIGRLRGR